jgi:hypothetical protein
MKDIISFGRVADRVHQVTAAADTGEAALLCYVKMWRSLSLHLSEVSALETFVWENGHEDHGPQRKISAQGALDQVVTVFEQDGDYLQRFREVREVTIVSRSAQADLEGGSSASAQPCDQAGILFVEFEGLRITGKHPEPALRLHITLDTARFEQLYVQIKERSKEITSATLFCHANLYGDDVDLSLYRNDLPEYGMPRHKDAPSASTTAYLERMEIVFEKKMVLRAGGSDACDIPVDDRVTETDLMDSVRCISKRLGWVIALLAALLILMMLTSGTSPGNTEAPKSFRQIADMSWLIAIDAQSGRDGVCCRRGQNPTVTRPQGAG